MNFDKFIEYGMDANVDCKVTMVGAYNSFMFQPNKASEDRVTLYTCITQIGKKQIVMVQGSECSVTEDFEEVKKVISRLIQDTPSARTSHVLTMFRNAIVEFEYF